ncbi:hypothetical protein BH10PLA1_BH10PLA1_13440 [soil metagenome]
MNYTLVLRVWILALLIGFSTAIADPSAPSTTPSPTTQKATIPVATMQPIDIAGKQDFSDPSTLNDAAAQQLKGLCSLADFTTMAAADRHVYAFDPWPASTDELGSKSCTFDFRLGANGVTSEKVTFTPSGGGPGGVRNLKREKNADGTKSILTGFGNHDWSGNVTHLFTFDKPVLAFGVVIKSTDDLELRKFYWQAAVERNGFPVSYTLADGTIVQLGARDVRGALIKGDTNSFIGVIDRSGTGIMSVTFTLKGLAGNKSESATMSELAFVTMPKPAVASVINLKSSCDFESPETIAAAPTPALKGLATLDAFRFIVGNHRYVYRFETWPVSTPEMGSNTGEFAFDLKGKGNVGQKVTVTANNPANNAKLTQATLMDTAGLPYRVLGGLGDIGQAVTAEQTFKFEKPVWAFGVTYRSPGDVRLTAGANSTPVSYTLSDGSVVNLGAAGTDGGVIAANSKTFVGVIDDTDKGISSVTLRVQGTASGAQPLFIEDLAFAMAGPPPGDWKLTMSDDFNGDQLDPQHWSTGYKFVDVINSEMQGYVPENVTVSNGICTIKAEKRECKNTDRWGKQGQTQHFASGAFTSVDKFTQTYGYFEARIKMPKARGAGQWPAFWILPDRGREYPDNVRYGYMNNYGRGMEIDIFEFMPRWKQPNGLFPIHMGCIWSYGKVTEKDPAPHGYGGFGRANDGWGPEELQFPGLDTEFHTYGLYWSPERLIWYLDSKPIFRVKDAKHMPDVPHFFLFNLAIHGNGWGKSPDKKNPTMSDIIADMPGLLEIDYFRAYSGTLEEAVPTPPSDVPGIVTRYSPPPKAAATLPSTMPASPTTSTGPSIEVPAAPVNSQISSPSN